MNSGKSGSDCIDEAASLVILCFKAGVCFLPIIILLLITSRIFKNQTHRIILERTYAYFLIAQEIGEN